MSARRIIGWSLAALLASGIFWLLAFEFGAIPTLIAIGASLAISALIALAVVLIVY